MAARKRSASDIARLQAILDAQRGKQRSRALVARDGAFHREIAAISGNPIFPALMFKWLAASIAARSASPDWRNSHFRSTRRFLKELCPGIPKPRRRHG